jgi:hypothetical protein
MMIKKKHLDIRAADTIQLHYSGCPVVAGRLRDQLNALQWEVLCVSCIQPRLITVCFAHFWLIRENPQRLHVRI